MVSPVKCLKTSMPTRLATSSKKPKTTTTKKHF